jgi:hypothetical protein
MTYRININVPPGDGWVLLPPGQPGRSGLFSAARGKDKDLPGWAAATARELLGPQADPELLARYTDTLSGSAADARARGMKLAWAWMSEPAGQVARIEVSTLHVSRGQPALELDALEKQYAERDGQTTELEVSRVELPAGPAVRLRREWHQTAGDRSDAVVSVTYVCRPPQIKDAIVYMMYWVLVDDEPLFTEIADALAPTLRITSLEPGRAPSAQ